MDRDIKDLLIEESESECEEELLIKIAEYEHDLIGSWKHKKRKNDIQEKITKTLRNHGEIN